jgi:hypothetical protein
MVKKKKSSRRQEHATKPTRSAKLGRSISPERDLDEHNFDFTRQIQARIHCLESSGVLKRNSGVTYVTTHL